MRREVAALRGEVAQLSGTLALVTEQIRSLKTELSEVRDSVSFANKLMDEMRYDPVVTETLMFLPDDAKTNNIHRAVGGDGKSGSPQP